MPSPLLLKYGIIADPSPSAPRVLYDHALLIEDGRIVRIAPYREFFEESGVAELDLSGRIILPGFINLHTHLYSTFARGLHTIEPAADFTGVLKNLWWRLDRALTVDACYYSAIPVLLEAIRCGTTTIVDHHASPMAVRGSLHALQRALQDTGVRGCLCYEVSDRDGEKVAEEGIEENAAFLASCGKDDDAMLQGTLRPSCVFHTFGPDVGAGRYRGARKQHGISHSCCGSTCRSGNHAVAFRYACGRTVAPQRYPG